MKYRRNILIEDLKEGMEIAESVYVKYNAGAPLLVARKGTIINAKMINALMRYQVKWAEVLTDTPPPVVAESFMPRPQPKPKRELPSDMPEIKPVLSPKLREEAIHNISELFSVLNKPGEIVNMTTAYQAVSGFENALNQVLIAVTEDVTGFVHINDLKSYDEYTYHHSLSVALLSIATGQVMGLNAKELQNLGRCALLHDMGKQSIPLEIINKAGKLTNEEFAIVKSHPTSGAATLKQKAIGNIDLWNGVMFHHEKYNGSGYPKGLLKNEIPLFSRIIAVADVYDAVTSYRSYRTPMTPDAAYELICSEVGTAFEYDIVKAFAKRLVLYPTGTPVELSDKRWGIVVESENAMRPVVKILETDTIIDMDSPAHLSISITKVLTVEELER